MTMRVLYFEPFSGISGDMTVAALVDLGSNPGRIEAELRGLGIGGYELAFRRVSKAGIGATKFDVELAGAGADHHLHAESHHHRTFRHIRDLIDASSVSDWVKV